MRDGETERGTEREREKIETTISHHTRTYTYIHWNLYKLYVATRVLCF